MIELYEIVVDMFAHFDYRKYFALEPKEKLNFILDAANYISELTGEKTAISSGTAKNALRKM